MKVASIAFELLSLSYLYFIFLYDVSSEDGGIIPTQILDGNGGAGSSMSGSIKRRLLDEFEATTSKKGKKVMIKTEKK